jgi:aspartyl-tRNA(Asn)/glutamyl-tRNA(Gln) amidotransferase subunit A
MNLNQMTIKQAHQSLVKKEFSSEELTRACLAQIKDKDKDIHAFIGLMEEPALEQARAVDEKIRRGEKISFLAGIPLAIKDNIVIKDTITTAGSRILENFRSPYDATVIKKLKETDAVFLGKANLDEFAMGSSTENSYSGPTRNPRDLERVPGGSSGGSAAAVAADMCLGALGSDTGGSIRQPASFCGVVGLKPTYGRVSRSGLMAMASSLDQIGPITRSVEDIALLLAVIEGKDILDSTSLEPMFPIEPEISANIQNLKIGVAKEYFTKGIDKQVEKNIRNIIKELANRGAKIEEVNLPHTKYALACYYIIMPAEVSANLARYDGIRYGYSKDGKNLMDVYLKSRERGLGDEVRRRIMLGTYTLSAGYYDAYYLQAQKVRTLIKQDFTKVFKKVDCLITPTTPTTAFKLGEKITDPLTMYLSDIYTVSVNLAGLPAISVPCPVRNPDNSGGRETKNAISNGACGQVGKLPVGLQVIGNYFREDQILKVAKAVESI